MKSHTLYIVSLLVIILSACGTPQTVPVANLQPSEIRTPEIGETYTELTVQEVRTFNCDGANPTTIVSRSLLQEQTTFFEVEVEAGGLIRGTPIPEVLQAELEAKIKAAIGSNLGNKYQQTITINLETQPGLALKHDIAWNETKVKGLIEVVYQNGIAKLNFQKIIGLQLYGRKSEQLSCEGQSDLLPKPTQAVVTPIILTIVPPVEIIATATLEPQERIIPTAESGGPLREHTTTSIGTGIFEKVTYSDGNAPYTEAWLWDNNHFNIQRIRREEYPDGCGKSGYEVNKVWIGSGAKATISVNGVDVGEYISITSKNKHGYIVDLTLHVGDKICISPIASSGFHIIFGPDIYYHYDSYCYRGNC